MKQIPLYMSPIAKLDGLKLTENLLACSIRVNFQNGTSVEYDLQGQPLKPLAVERLVQSLLSICSTSQSASFGKLLDVNLAPSNAMICAVRLHRSLSSEVFAGPLLSVYLTSLTIESDEPNQANGGKIILSED